MNKKIIIALITCLIVLIIITAIFISRGNNDTINNSINQPNITPISGLEDILPGTLVPTTNIQPGEIDIVSVSPQDRSSSIVKTQPIEISFSQPIQDSDFELRMIPELSYSQTIVDNKLIITPNEDFQMNTLYTYRIKIFSDLEKIRVYTFSTAGDEPIFRPNTAPETEDIQEYKNSERISNPDIYVMNHTPYESNSFGITGTFSDQSPAHFEFKVLLKEPNKNDSRAAFIIWLQSLDLTDEQIASLDITYE